MIQIRDYLAKKENGLVEIIKAGGGVALVIKKYSPDTGEQLNPEIIAIDLKEVKTVREQLVSDIAGLDLLIADLESKTGNDSGLFCQRLSAKADNLSAG